MFSAGPRQPNSTSAGSNAMYTTIKMVEDEQVSTWSLLLNLGGVRYVWNFPTLQSWFFFWRVVHTKQELVQASVQVVHRIKTLLEEDSYLRVEVE